LTVIIHLFTYLFVIYSFTFFIYLFILKFQMFYEANVQTTIGCHDIRTKKDFFLALSSLITANIEVKRWVFKLDNDSDIDECNGGGNNLWQWIAYLDVEK
jgi:hypothetical protein